MGTVEGFDDRRAKRAQDQDGIHVLLIERDRSVAGAVTDMLRTVWPRGLAVTHAERFEDAGQQLLGAGLTAILLSSDGEPSALEQVRLLAPRVPVIVLAGSYEPGEASLALRGGAQDYIERSHLSPASLGRALLHAVERKRTELTITHRALQDPLTGLPNRTLFMDRLGLALDRARRTGALVGVLFLDVDDFKAINDSLGHGVGDRVLNTIGARLRSVLRPMDTVARFGGDEFTFLFEDLSTPAEALAIAERIRQAMLIPISIEGSQRRLGVSIGVATTPGDRTPADLLIQQADLAMYESKHRRSGDPVLHGEAAHEAADGELDLAEELRRALERSELGVVFQPSYRLGDGPAVSGFEALARWRHPRLGAIPPRDFIPLAEQSGLVAALDEFVLRRALEVLGRLQTADGQLTLSVNMSGDELGDDGLARMLEAVADAGIDPGAICVEVSERAVSEHPERAARATRLLRSAGVRVAIDDYGTGTASIGSLRELQASELKLHESFVSGLDRDGDTAVVGAVVELAHALGMRVVAEGVETDRQLGALRMLGCDDAQGYLLCRPVEAEQLEELLMRVR